jgi:hypothetical protein
VLAEVGIPRYLKADIEGLDMLCVRALREFDERPDFVSVESAVSSLDAPLENVFDELAELWSLGYRRLAYVNQNGHPFRRAPNPPREGRYVDTPLTFTQSGYFGEEMPERWRSIGPTLVRAQAIRVAGEYGLARAAPDQSVQVSRLVGSSCAVGLAACDHRLSIVHVRDGLVQML